MSTRHPPVAAIEPLRGRYRQAAAQIARHGKAVLGMPPLVVYPGTDGELIVHDGVTRDASGQAAAGPVGARGGDRAPTVARVEIPNRRRAIAMIDPMRQEILQVLGELSEVVPDVRLGQLLANLSYLARGLSSEAIWNMDDEELLAVAREHLEEWRSREEYQPDETLQRTRCAGR